MACKDICKLCKRLIISTAVNFDSTSNEVIIALPAGPYYNGEKYCIIVAQNIPTAARINSLVTFSLGSSPTRIPLVDCNCIQVTACSISTRTKYSTVVCTNTTSGVFKLLGNLCCCRRETLPSLPATTQLSAINEKMTALDVVENEPITVAMPKTATKTPKKEVVAND